MPMSLERGVPVQSMIAGWAPSRAINPSRGDDPVSLGLVPAFPGQASTVLPAVTHAPSEMPDNPGKTLPAPALDVDGHQAHPTWISPETGQARLRNTYINLMPSEQAALLSILIGAYERQIRDEITSLKLEYGLDLLPADQRRDTVFQTDFGARVLPGVSAEGEAPLTETERAAGRTQLQQVLAPFAVRPLPCPEEGASPAPPCA